MYLVKIITEKGDSYPHTMNEWEWGAFCKGMQPGTTFQVEKVSDEDTIH